MSADLATLAADPALVEDVDRADLPELIGQAASLHARLLAALHRPVKMVAPAANGVGEPDRLLTVEEAADLLAVTTRWLYRQHNAGNLPFARKLSSGTLRFSSRGLERWQESRR